MELARRDFVRGAAVLTGATIASMGAAQAMAAEKEAQSSETEEETTSDSTAGTEPSETRDYDVVVVGAGGAGMSAATRAAQGGLNVVLLESAEQTGGTTLFTEGLFAVNSHWQIENNVNPDEDWIFQTAMDYHHWFANGSLFKKYIDTSADDIDWMESVGIEFKGTGTMCDNEYNTWHQYNYQEGEISGAPYVAAWTAAVQNAGATIELGCEATELVVTDGRVTGVIAQQGDTTIQFNGSKGIILATGGYADNDDMIVEIAGFKSGHVRPMGAGTRTGFGIRAARELGADFAKSPDAMAFYGGDLTGTTYGTQLYCAACFQPLFWINQDCDRFVNEYYAERNFSFSGNAQAMQDRVISIVTKAQMDQFVEQGGIFGCGEYLHAGEPLTELWDQYEAAAQDNQYIQDADTLEELAEKFDLDPDKLVASVEKYNGYCAEGKDGEFGKDPQYLIALEEGPYYGFEMKAGIFCTVGGLRIDNDAHVLDEDKKPIPGLFAAGCDAGGIYGDAYDVSICEGSCQGFAVFSGRTAADTILADE